MKKTCCAVGVALLAGCGGGSGGGTPPSNDTLQPLSLWQDFVSKDRAWRTLGLSQVGNLPIEVNLSLQPKGMASLSVSEPGKDPQTRTYERVDFSARLMANAAVYESTQLALYLDPTHKTIVHMVELGDAYSLCAGYSEADAYRPEFLPPTASTTDSGLIFGAPSYPMKNGGCYFDPNSRSGASNALNWSYQTINGRPMFCMEHTHQMAHTSWTNYCFEMATRSTLGAAAVFTTNSRAIGGGNATQN